MRNSKTIGFAVADEDSGRLDHLADVFAGGNRSELLRRAMDVMERLESAQTLASLQAYGQQQLAGSGLTPADIPAIVERAITNPDPTAVAEAKLIVAGIAEPHRIARGAEPTTTSAGALFRELATERPEPPDA